MVAEDLTLHDLNQRMLAAVDGIREGLDAYRDASHEWVNAERDYREAKSKALLEVDGRSSDVREAQVFVRTTDEWYTAHLAEVVKDSAKEALRGHSAILSGLQSLAAAHRSEAELARYEPSWKSA